MKLNIELLHYTFAKNIFLELTATRKRFLFGANVNPEVYICTRSALNEREGVQLTEILQPLTLRKHRETLLFSNYWRE